MTLTGYRGPALAGAMMLLALAWWTWLEIGAVERRHRDELRRFVDGILLALDASHEVLRRPGSDPRGADLVPRGHRPPPHRRGDDLSTLQPVLHRIVSGQPSVRAIEIRRDGEVQIAAGTVLATSVITGHRGEVVHDGLFVGWRPLGLRPPRPSRGRVPHHEEAPTNGAPDPTRASARTPPPGAPLAVIAVDATGNRERRRQQALQIAQKIGAAGLATAAVLAAWVLGIRSRCLEDRLRSERMRREHLEELSLAASGLAHETKNPLGIIRGLAQSLQARDGLGEAGREAAAQIQEEADRAVARLGEFMSYARVREPEPGPVRVAALVHRAFTVLAADLEAAGVTAHQEGPDVTVLADEDMLLQILLNLLLNGLEASEPETAITVRLAVDRGRATLTVADRGHGIDPQVLVRLFKPYVTGRAEGHGLGLATVKRMVDHHGWTIAADSRPGLGTTLTIAGIAVVGEAGGTP